MSYQSENGIWSKKDTDLLGKLDKNKQRVFG